MLNDEQAAFFRKLAVFDRGWTLEAAVALCRDGDQTEIEVVRLLEQLNDMSLLVIEEGAGQRRFRLLDSIREYAHQELVASKEEEALSEAHARWFMQLAEQAAPELLKKSQGRWLDTLSVEADNLRAAAQWSVDNGQADVALRLATSLWRLAEIRGLYDEGMRGIRTALDMPEAAGYPALRARAHSGIGMLAYRKGDMGEAERSFQASLDLDRQQNNLPGIANALNDLGNVAQLTGDFATARTRYDESLDIERNSGNARGIAVGLFNLGNTARRMGLVDEAADPLHESRQRFEADGNLREAAFPLNSLALLALAREDMPTAEKYAHRSLEIRQDLNDTKGISDSMRTLGVVRMEQGDLSGARDLLWKSMDLARSLDAQRGIVETLDELAALAAVYKQFASCVAIYAAAEKLREKIRIPLAPAELQVRDRHLEAARQSLGGARFEKWQETGGYWSVEDALREVERLNARAASQDA